MSTPHDTQGTLRSLSEEHGDMCTTLPRGMHLCHVLGLHHVCNPFKHSIARAHTRPWCAIEECIVVHNGRVVTGSFAVWRSPVNQLTDLEVAMRLKCMATACSSSSNMGFTLISHFRTLLLASTCSHHVCSRRKISTHYIYMLRTGLDRSSLASTRHVDPRQRRRVLAPGTRSPLAEWRGLRWRHRSTQRGP